MAIGIYGILNKIDYKIYVGKAKNIERRFREHKNYLSKTIRNKNTNRYLFNAVKKYGLDSFEFIIFETFKFFDEDLLADSEVCWIDHFSATDTRYGYNLTRSSATKVDTHFDTKILFSKRVGKLNSNYGNKWTKEQKNRQSNIIKQNRLQGKYDFMLTEEFKNNRLKKHKEYLEQKVPEYRLSFCKYDKNSKELIEMYENIEVLMTRNPTYIKTCIYTACNKGKNYKGYIWKSFKLEKT